MNEEDGKQEEKFEFTPEGESIEYISLDQAKIQAIVHARDKQDFYPSMYAGIRLIWEVLVAEESEDHYDVRLSFRPGGGFQGKPGVEQLIFDKTGELRVRQILDEPTDNGIALDSEQIVYVTDGRNDRINVIGPYGKLLAEWGSSGSAPGEFNWPSGLALDADGKIYVVDRENHRIQVFERA